MSKPSLDNWREEIKRLPTVDYLEPFVSNLLLPLLERVNATLHRHYAGELTEEGVAKDLKDLKKKLREEIK